MSYMKRLLSGIAIPLLFVSVGFADVKLARVLSDGMVLQREKYVPVWGWANPGAEVSVSFAGQEQRVFASDQEGYFIAHLKKMEASATPRELSVESGNETVVVKNVLVGEVWLCSGQSNMARRLTQAKNAKEEIAAANYSAIRMFLTDHKGSIEPLKDCEGSWFICSPENAAPFSAVAYFFGRRLHKELDVPVGLIRSCWGGTRIEPWTPLAALEKFPSVMEDKRSQNEKAESFDRVAVEKDYQARLAQWRIDAESAIAEGRKPPKRFVKPMHPYEGRGYPGNLFNAMIHPHVPYGIRGFLWYQGEGNTKTLSGSLIYGDLLQTMIHAWR